MARFEPLVQKFHNNLLFRAVSAEFPTLFLACHIIALGDDLLSGIQRNMLTFTSRNEDSARKENFYSSSPANFVLIYNIGRSQLLANFPRITAVE